MLSVRPWHNAVLRAEKSVPKENISNFRMEPEDKAEFSFEILVSTFKVTRCHDLNNDGHEHLKYYIILICTFPLLTCMCLH